MTERSKIYFASDFHLGVPNYEKSLEREKVIVKWLEEIRFDAKEIFLVGDIFDYWYEYTFVIPKGYVRLQGKIAEIVDSGIPVHFFTGNHDMWMGDYFPKELGVSVNHEPIQREFNGKKFYIGHGDGLGPGDWSYKLQKFFFTNKLVQWCFSRLHPNFASYVASSVSKKSRINTGSKDSILTVRIRNGYSRIVKKC